MKGSSIHMLTEFHESAVSLQLSNLGDLHGFFQQKKNPMDEVIAFLGIIVTDAWDLTVSSGRKTQGSHIGSTEATERLIYILCKWDDNTAMKT